MIADWTPWSFLTQMAGQYRCVVVPTTEMTLQEAVGLCGGWAVFMRDSLAVHGIATVKASVSSLPGFPRGPAGARSMLIKNWSFSATPTGAGNFPYETVVDHLVDATGRISGVYIGTPQFTDKPGLPGQGNENPPGFFDVGDHAVVTYGGEIYDPSYGTGPFPDIVSWAMASLDGYARVTTSPPLPLPGGGAQVRSTFEAHRGVP